MADQNRDEAGDPGFEINEDDIVEVIDLTDEIESDEALADHVDDMDLDQPNDGEGDEEFGASGGAEDMEEVQDCADLVFSKHADSVFCVDTDPMTSQYAATGGQDDKAFVWSISSGEVLWECTGHKDSVTCVGFSHDGTYLATADLSGLIKVWKVSTKQEVWCFECSDIEWLQWHPSAHVLVAGTMDGDMWMWKVPGGECRTFQGHGCTANSGKIMPDGKRACVGYDDGAVKIWDLKGSSVLHNISGYDGHKSSVVCIDCHHDNSVVISGSTDVTAKIINSTSGKVLGTLDCSKKNKDGDPPAEDSVEAVGFSKVQNYAATGSLTGSLCIWDVPTLTPRHICSHQSGVVKLWWDSCSPLLYTCCLDGVARLWDARNGECVTEWSGHQDSILDFSITRDGNTLVTVSEDKTSRVFSLNSPER